MAETEIKTERTTTVKTAPSMFRDYESVLFELLHCLCFRVKLIVKSKTPEQITSNRNEYRLTKHIY